MKYIQSFYQYPITFSSIGKTLPCKDACGEMRNIAEFSDKEIERLKTAEPLFRELLNKKKIRILNHLPQSYIPPAKQINDARSEVDALKAEKESLLARIAELEKAKESKEESKKKTKESKEESKKKE